MENTNSSYWKILLFLLLLFLVPNIINSDLPFYEDGVYKMHAESMIQDKDFNIINQDSPQRAWMVTETFFHSDAHPLVQTPLLVLFYEIENALDLFSSQEKGKEFRFYLSSFFINVILVFMGIHFCREIGKRINIVVSNYAMILFSFASSFFYFSFFYYNVIEVFCFPFMAYLCLVALKIQDKDSKINNFEMCSVGGAIGILLSVKLTYLPICILVLYKILRKMICHKSLTKLGYLILFFSLIYFSSVTNRKLQFGENIEYSLYVKYMCDYSLQGLFESLTKGFFGVGGLFYSNPAFLISILGLVKLAWNYREKIDVFSALMLMAWLGMSLFQTVPIVGYILDDHLVGRLNLTALPLLIIGFCFCYEKCMKSVHRKKYSFLFYFLVLWQCINLISYFGLKTQGHFYYAGHKIISWDLIPQAYHFIWERAKLNAGFLFSNISLISLFFILMAFIVKSLNSRFRRDIFFNFLTFFVVITFLCTTLLNYKYAPENIVRHKADKLYENKVVVKAGGILVYDYILDRLNAVNESDDEYGKTQIARILDDYFALISTQVVMSTEKFDKNLREKKLNSTIYHQAE
jgi:hypothetical protein